MCTLSWWVEADRRGVLFNRDEQRSRQPGGEPRLIAAEGTQAYGVLAPIDLDAAGSWIGVNERGLVVALLNYYGHDTTVVDQRRSRGKLVLDLLSSQSSTPNCIRELDAIDMSPYPGCLLFCMDDRHQPKARQWDGRSLSSIPLNSEAPCLTTSSVRTETCVAYRKKRFEGTYTRDQLKEAHMHYDVSDPALGPLMRRDDAATDCFTEIVLDAQMARMSFHSFHGKPPVAGVVFEDSISLRK